MDISKGKEISIHFGQGAEADEYKLFQMTEDMVEMLQAQKSFDIRGQEGSSAVLCTPTETFSIKLVENSNTLLLIEPKDDDGDVGVDANDENDSRANVSHRMIRGTVTCTYEMTKTLPQLHVLRSTLEGNEFTQTDAECRLAIKNAQRKNKRAKTGNNNDNDNDNDNDNNDTDNDDDDDDISSMINRQKNKQKHTTDTLRKSIQASNEELRQGLLGLGAIELDGYWYVLQYTLMSEIFDHMLIVMASKGWSFKNVPGREMVEELANDYDADLVLHALRVHSMDKEGEAEAETTSLTSLTGSKRQRESDTSKSSSAGAQMEEVFYQLDPLKTCRFRVRQLFLQHAKESSKSKNTGRKGRSDDGKDACIMHHQLMKEWTEAVPTGMYPTTKMLEGLAIQLQATVSQTLTAQKHYEDNDVRVTKEDKHLINRKWKFLQESSLPNHAARRIRQLFKERSVWSQAEIRPYIKNVLPPHMKLDQLLLKYCMSMTRAEKKREGETEDDVLLYKKRR